MSKLTIVANIIAKKDKIELIKSELTKLIEPTRAEDACINYDLHQDNQKPEHFLFFENWGSRESWLEHMETPHIKACLEVVEDSLESFEVNEMTFIG